MTLPVSSDRYIGYINFVDEWRTMVGLRPRSDNDVAGQKKAKPLKRSKYLRRVINMR